MITCEIVEGKDKISSYQAQWRTLFDAGAYEPSLSLEWSQALLDTHLRGDRFFAMLLKDGKELVGIVPLCIQRVRKKGTSLLTMFPLAEYFNTHSDLLIRDPSEELIETFLKAISTVPWKWDLFRINRFVETSPVLKVIEDKLQKNSGTKYEVHRTEPSFFIDLESGYHGYLASKSSNFRNNLRRAAKKMQALGQIDYRGIQDFANVTEAYEVIFSIEEKSWKHQHGTSIASTPKQREFYRELCTGAYDRRCLRLCVLNLDHSPIAFEMGLVKGRKYYGVHGSYDEKFKKENPGTVLLARFLEDLARDGIQEYDWFGEPFEWESRWTDKYRWHKSLLIYNRTPKAKLFSLFNSVKVRLGRKAPDELVLQNPRDVRPQSEES